VVVCRPVEREVTDYADFTGRAEASTTVEVRSRITATLEKTLFKEGGEVKKGDVLFQLDDRGARANFAKIQAQVAEAEAHLKAAEIDYRRMTKLADAKA